MDRRAEYHEQEPEKPVMYREANHNTDFRWFEKNGEVWLVHRMRSSYTQKAFHEYIKSGMMIPAED